MRKISKYNSTKQKSEENIFILLFLLFLLCRSRKNLLRRSFLDQYCKTTKKHSRNIHVVISINLKKYFSTFQCLGERGSSKLRTFSQNIYVLFKVGNLKLFIYSHVTKLLRRCVNCSTSSKLFSMPLLLLNVARMLNALPLFCFGFL